MNSDKTYVENRVQEFLDDRQLNSSEEMTDNHIRALYRRIAGDLDLYAGNRIDWYAEFMLRTYGNPATGHHYSKILEWAARFKKCTMFHKADNQQKQTLIAVMLQGAENGSPPMLKPKDMAEALVRHEQHDLGIENTDGELAKAAVESAVDRIEGTEEDSHE